MRLTTSETQVALDTSTCIGSNLSFFLNLLLLFHFFFFFFQVDAAVISMTGKLMMDVRWVRVQVACSCALNLPPEMTLPSKRADQANANPPSIDRSRDGKATTRRRQTDRDAWSRGLEKGTPHLHSLFYLENWPTRLPLPPSGACSSCIYLLISPFG